MYKVVLDTDIGDDIDDAFALGLLLKNPNVDLLAVTTVYKNTLARAKQARALIELNKKNIPVFVGETYPLNGKITGFTMDKGDLATIIPCQYDSSMENLAVNNDAVEHIIHLAKKYSKELIIIAIGPIINIARALQKDPSISKDIKAIYQMGGWFTNFVPEWNILCDPEACDVVYKSNIPIYATGLDVTLQCPLDGSLLENLRKSNNEMDKTLTVWLDRWFDYFHFEKSILHDPLAVASLLDKNILEFETKYVKVVLEGEKRGAMLVSDTYQEGYSPINVAHKVDKDLFLTTIGKNFG